MTVKPASAILVLAALTSCSFKSPPTDAQIKRALIDYVTIEDTSDRAKLLQALAGSDDYDFPELPKEFEHVGFKSAGCAESTQSAGYVCTVETLITFKRTPSEHWPSLGTRKISGSVHLFKDKSQDLSPSGGWEVVRKIR